MRDAHFYFQVHQPFRLKEYDFSMIGVEHEYEDKNASLLNHIADKYYLPTNKLMLKLIKKHKGRLKVIFSMSGCAIEQFMLYRPDVLVSFQKLAHTNNVEFLAETYYHSLSFLYSPKEFERQVKKHHDKMKALFGKQPQVLSFSGASEKFALWVTEINNTATNICLDYESFRDNAYSQSLFDAATIEELLAKLKVNKPLALADEKQDWSVYLGNSMQKEAIKRIYSLEEKVLKSNSEPLIETWGRLQTSDYFYYMSTKVQNNNENTQRDHSPYQSPFDAYINYMNIISDFENLLVVSE